jgi:23S rRNA pseudouridine1911/1915/1917 synthase
VSGTRQRVAIPEALAGERADRALVRLVPELSRARVQKLVATGAVLLNGRRAKAASRVKAGDVLEVAIPAPVPAALVAEDIAIELLHDDADVAVVNKPAGMVVHPGAGAPRGTLANALLHRLSGLAGIGGEIRPGLVHRLDKDTSGCLVVAKNDRALAVLQAAFKARTVDKRYLAVCHGTLAERGRFDTPYGRHPTQRTRFTTKARGARRAITDWESREAFPGASLVELVLHTGRTHQIRVHLADDGHPLLHDATYGGTRREAKLPLSSPVRRAAEAIGRQALHAHRLAFEHPVSGKRLAFEAPLPLDFAAALAILRKR